MGDGVFCFIPFVREELILKIFLFTSKGRLVYNGKVENRWSDAQNGRSDDQRMNNLLTNMRKMYTKMLTTVYFCATIPFMQSPIN